MAYALAPSDELALMSLHVLTCVTAAFGLALTMSLVAPVVGIGLAIGVAVVTLLHPLVAAQASQASLRSR